MAEGMRFERGGKGKYWIPKPGQHEQEPLLSKVSSGRARAMSPGASRALDTARYGTTEYEDEDPTLNPEDERLFDSARALEFGDWNVSGILALQNMSHNSTVPRH
jgi:hypothetical protein